MHLNFEAIPFINNKVLSGSLSLESDQSCLLIYGNNGVGKSSLFQFLKLNQHQYFKTTQCRFVDQARLRPLNDLSFVQLKQQFSSKSPLDQNFYLKWEELIEDFKTKPIKNLSGGQNQLIKLLFALHLGGDTFLMDEPFQSLDYENIAKVKGVLTDLKQLSRKVILIEHHRQLVGDLSDKTYEMVAKSEQVELREK